MLPSTNRGRCKARGEGGDVVPWAVPLQLWANRGAEGASSVHCSGEGSQGAEMSTLWHPISPLLQQPRPLFKGPHLGLMGSSREFVSKVLFYFSLSLRDGCCLLSFCQCPLWASVLLARGEAAFQLGYIRLALFQGINFQILDFHVYLFLIRSAWECACRQLPWEGFFPSSPSTFKEEGMPLISSWFYGALSKVIICWCCFN